MKPKEKIAVIEKLDLRALGEPLNIDLKNAEVTFYVIIDKLHEKVYFSRLIAKTRVSGKNRSILSNYDNSLRPYQAPTCLDHELAFILANMARICKHDLVYDPFVGSASTLVSAGHFGAITVGSEIDERVIHGTGVGRKNYHDSVNE